MSGGRRGLDRERRLRELLERDGWWTMRAAGSLGVVDVLAMRAGSTPLFIEVKSTSGGPFERFGPSQRAALSTAAALAGATAWLVWWPPRRSPLWVPERDWPMVRAAA